MTAGVIAVRSSGGGLAALRGAVRRLRRGSPGNAVPGDSVPVDSVPAPSPLHPLRVAEVMQRAGLTYLPASDDAYRTVCPSCGRAQSLAQASVEPARDAGGITAYRCRNGCTVLATTGGADSATDAGTGWRFAVGDYVITALVPAGLQFTTGTPGR